MGLPVPCTDIFYKSTYPSKATISFEQGLVLQKYTNVQQNWTKTPGFRYEILHVRREGMSTPGLCKYLMHKTMWLF